MVVVVVSVLVVVVYDNRYQETEREREIIGSRILTKKIKIGTYHGWILKFVGVEPRNQCGWAEIEKTRWGRGERFTTQLKELLVGM